LLCLGVLRPRREGSESRADGEADGTERPGVDSPDLPVQESHVCLPGVRAAVELADREDRVMVITGTSSFR
jgi:hypothetical protein